MVKSSTANKIIIKNSLIATPGSSILDGEFSQGGAFKEGLEKDKMNGYPEFNELVDYCLNSLVRNELIKEVSVQEPNHRQYLGTQRLSAFCSDILEFEMLDVEGLVKAVTEGEKEIRYDKSSSAIISLLQSLKDGEQVHHLFIRTSS